MSDRDPPRMPPRYPFTRGNPGAEPPASKPGGDPLAELARLIGQRGDPFESDPIPPSARRDLRDILSGKRRADWPESPDLTARRDDDGDRYGDEHDQADTWRVDGEHDIPAEPPPHVETHRAYHSALAVDDLPPEGRGFDDQAPYDPQSQYDDAPEAPLYGDNGQLVPDDGYGSGTGFSAREYAPDEVAEEAPRGRKGLFAVVAVFALAVVGTAGAYAYRTMNNGAAGVPPLIRADSTPNKIPATQTADAGSGKQIYDRLGSDRPQNEKVVSREEQPVDVRPAQPRATFPMATGMNAQPSTPANSGWPQPAGAAPTPIPPGLSPSANEPRRIRTIPIRADQVASAPPVEAVPQSTTQAAAPPPSVPARPAPRQAVTPPPAPTHSAPARSAREPMSLNPQASGSSRSRNVQTAAVTPQAAPSGAYVVQIAANKTQDEAAAAFHSAQSRYPSILGSRKLLIRKKVIAGKGTFYGAQVGPFADRGDATQLCENLKAAGGNCIVQRN
jgi:hypothetical protein